MRKLLRWLSDAALARRLESVEKQLLDTKADLDASKRVNSILEREREALANVLARNVERIKAESSEASRRIAENEHSAGTHERSEQRLG